jgi:hypothetical protein
MRNRINEINVTISDRDTDVSGCTWDGAFWHWTVKFDREGKSFTVPYYGGKAVEEITEEEVLANCLQEALAVIQTDDFEDFCNEFGYDIFDFAEAEDIYSAGSREVYNACMKMWCDFCHILGFGLSALEGEACDWLNEHNI